MTVKFVEAKKEDYTGFVEVFKEIEELHRLNVSWKFKKQDPIFSKEYFEKLINDGKCFFLLAKDKDEIVGYTIAYKEEVSGVPVLKDRKWIHIDDLAVKSKQRKKGLGSMIMEEVERWAKRNKYNEIDLNVWLFNKNAINFYEKKGYKAYSQKMRKTIE
jgi:ribosomal protein S18 acetylase RimI-like enzyme